MPDEPTPQEDLLPSEPAAEAAPAFATLVATDGRLLRLVPAPDGSLTITMRQREPVVLDPFQTAALRLAVAAIGGAT